MICKYCDAEIIDMADLTNLNLLKKYVICSDEFEELPKELQEEIYTYCKYHAQYEACIENLKQIRYAATRLYFGY